MENKCLTTMKVTNIKSKVGPGRPIKVDKKPLNEIIQYHNTRLKEKGYFKDYYLAKSSIVCCPYCNKQVKEFNLKPHQKTMKCLKAYSSFTVENISI